MQHLNPTHMKTRILLIHLSTLILLLFSSCKNSNPEDEGEMPISEEFILKTDESIKNNDFLADMIANIESMPFDQASSDENVLDGAKIDTLEKVVGELFDPSKNPCPIPQKVAKKLKKLNEDQKAYWAPRFVKDHISKMPLTVLHIPRRSLNFILHYVTVKKSNGSSFKYLVSRAPSYQNLEVDKFIVTSIDHFFYSLDCSGYLNASIEGSGAVPGADIKAVAKSALETQNSIFIGGGVVLSPLCAAFYGDGFDDTHSDSLMRKAILKSIVAIPNTSDSDTLDINLSFDAVWASKEGKSSFNGRAEVRSGANAGFGIASVSASASSGGSISRKSEFSNFDTYVLTSHSLSKPSFITFKQVKDLLATFK
jgi:hypothetical protein